jgi:MurNAc alpha-1-phosphate uridylyltransferase
VLAAGRGGRLNHHTEEQPKCLVHVAGRPLIDYVLTAIAAAGISNVVLVVGYHGEQVQAFVEDGSRYGLRIEYAWNKDYTTGNAASFACALPLMRGEPFLLMMSDHLCSASLLRTFIEGTAGRTAIAVDRAAHGASFVAEATKVALVNGTVVDIGKGIASWDALDTGFSYWASGFELDGAPRQGELAALMHRFAQNGGMAACDVSGHFWHDIDTEEDICMAEALLRADERRLD